MRKVTIGCDPEFVVMDNNCAIPAYLMTDDFAHDAPLGSEIAQEMIVHELRPHYYHNTFKVLANIQKLLAEYIKRFPNVRNYQFIAGHMIANTYYTGGHIHIGWQKPTEDKVLNWDQERELRNFIDKIIRCGFMTVINDKDNHMKRKHAHYGRNNHSVFPRHGIEYKTPPSWLVNPTLTFIFLTLAKICVLMYLNADIWQANEYIKSIIRKQSSGIRFLKNFINEVKKIDELMKEEDVRKCIELLSNLRRRLVYINWEHDFLPNWGLK